jgi:hypothetical protein
MWDAVAFGILGNPARSTADSVTGWNYLIYPITASEPLDPRWYRPCRRYRPRAKAVSAALDTIRDSLKRGEKVTITGFGIFETAHRGPTCSTWRLVEA